MYQYLNANKRTSEDQIALYNVTLLPTMLDTNEDGTDAILATLQ